MTDTTTRALPGLVLPLLEAALAGAREVMSFYGVPPAPRAKTDGSPVTLADEAAEAAIVAALERSLPGVPVVAEEAAASGVVPEAGRVFILVDPLDGTKEFVSGSGEFTVNVALIEGGRPVAGAVIAPAIGKAFVGVPGSGAFEARATPHGIPEVWRIIATRPLPTGGFTAVASRSHAGQETEAFLSRIGVSERVSAGSSLKFCLVASGDADVYPRLGRTMEWDTAAGQAVLVAAGGTVTDLGGVTLAYGKSRQANDAPYANPHFVAWGRPEAAIAFGAVGGEDRDGAA